jgi:hypothetical protein
MSFILDALKKSENDRQRQTGPALFEVKVAQPKAGFPVWAIAIVALLAVNMVIVGWLLLRHSSRSEDGAAQSSQPPVASQSAPTQGSNPGTWSPSVSTLPPPANAQQGYLQPGAQQAYPSQGAQQNQSAPNMSRGEAEGQGRMGDQREPTLGGAGEEGFPGGQGNYGGRAGANGAGGGQGGGGAFGANGAGGGPGGGGGFGANGTGGSQGGGGAFGANGASGGPGGAGGFGANGAGGSQGGGGAFGANGAGGGPGGGGGFGANGAGGGQGGGGAFGANGAGGGPGGGQGNNGAFGTTGRGGAGAGNGYATAAGAGSTPSGNDANGGGNPDDYAPAQDPASSLFKGHVKRGTASGLMLYQDLAVTNGSNLPELRLDMHVYDAKPENRFALINMQRMHEGDSIKNVRLEAITPDGVVMSHNGTKFLLPRE